MEEEDILKQIFGDDYVDKRTPQDFAFINLFKQVGTKYNISWCSLCETIRLGHIDCPNNGTTCNACGCPDCNKDFELFHLAKDISAGVEIQQLRENAALMLDADYAFRMNKMADDLEATLKAAALVIHQSKEKPHKFDAYYKDYGQYDVKTEMCTLCGSHERNEICIENG